MPDSAEKTERQNKPPVVHSTVYTPDRLEDRQTSAFIIPGIFMDATTKVMREYGQQRANRLHVRTYLMSVHLIGRSEKPLEDQARAIAEHIASLAKGKPITLGGDSQGANIALTAYRILREMKIPVSELHLRFPRGLTRENRLGLAEIVTRDIIGTTSDMVLHMWRNRKAFPVIGRYLAASAGGARRALRDRSLIDTIDAAGLLNHDTKFVIPPTKVIIELGYKDAVAYFRELFPYKNPEKMFEILSEDMQRRFFTSLPKENIELHLVNARHLGLLYQNTVSYHTKKRWIRRTTRS